MRVMRSYLRTLISRPSTSRQDALREAVVRDVISEAYNHRVGIWACRHSLRSPSAELYLRGVLHAKFACPLREMCLGTSGMAFKLSI